MPNGAVPGGSLPISARVPVVAGFGVGDVLADAYNPRVSAKLLQVRLLLAAPANLGPGKVRLLEAIADTGSISGAARHMKISYRRAWLMIDSLNNGFPHPLVVTSTGGNKGGGACLTELGQSVLTQYMRILARAEQAASEEAAALIDLLAGR